MVAKNPGRSKRKNALVVIDKYIDLERELADQKETNNFLQTSSNLRKAERERLEKEFSVALINSECYCRFFNRTDHIFFFCLPQSQIIKQF